MRWSKRDTAAIIDMRDRKQLPWKVIGAAFPGRTDHACKTHYYQSTKPAVPRQLIFAIQAPAAPASGRTMSTAALIADQDLRNRIAVLGPNGLFGDPMPGRSALDRKRAGGAV
jgi:hypothetical protein